MDSGLVALHQEVLHLHAWEPSSPRAVDLILRVGARIETLLALGDMDPSELQVAVSVVGYIDPPEHSRTLPNFQRRAVIRDFLDNPHGPLARARELALAAPSPRNPSTFGRELSVGNTPRAPSALQHAECMDADELFARVEPVVADGADELAPLELRAVARAVSRLLWRDLPTTAKQQRQLVVDWLADERRARRLPARPARAEVAAAPRARKGVALVCEIEPPRAAPPPRFAQQPQRTARAADAPVAPAAAGPRACAPVRKPTAFVVEADGAMRELTRAPVVPGVPAPADAATSLGGRGATDEAADAATARALLAARDEAAPIAGIDDDRLSAMLVSPGVALSHVSWRCYGALGSLNRAWRSWRAQESVWRAMCAALARESQLYLPRLVPPSSAEARVLAAVGGGGHWARLWWEALYPARGAWLAAAGSVGAAGGGGARVVDRFKISVAVRLKPGAREADGKLLLPLHQRLRMRQPGEQIGHADAEVTVDSLRKAGLLAEGAHLSADVLAALSEARALDVSAQAVRAAELRARGRRAAADDGADDADDADDGADDGAPAPAATADAAAGGAAAGAAAAGGLAGDPSGSKRAAAGPDEPDDTPDGGRFGGARVLLVQPSRVVMFYPGIGLRPFEFARVFDGSVAQSTVYEGAARAAVAAALNGLNACLLLYGQTGSGKTHTAFGPPGVLEPRALDAVADEVAERARTGRHFAAPAEWGLALRACAELMAEVAAPTVAGVRTSVSAQYVQVYADRVYDLLNDRQVVLRAGAAPTAVEGGGAAGCAGIQLVGADERPCAHLAELLALLSLGESRKRYRATNMNERSSRAHTLLLLNVTRANADVGAVSHSHLHLVDLAGSEQLKLSGAHGVSRNEAVAINSSLLCLGKVVSALLEERAHVPYRESALTLLLRASLGGSSRTTCIVTAPLSDAHAEQTFQSLKFGERCSLVTNTAALHVSSLDDALVAIDDALARCGASIAGLEARGLGDSDGARKLRERSAELTQKRAALNAVPARDEKQ